MVYDEGGYKGLLAGLVNRVRVVNCWKTTKARAQVHVFTVQT